ncbi:hypothetical protein EI427_12320 [Flammeovirga pectinis]|uniref:Uncharacterized protein n=1 Tax=Flammeovirga pectinis TaxID=2494373 RepID=A0A3S9P447_9BACT|nr:hypothetical protein [Flammeovirga pectinis]AZQ62997.1 hypothetical protein EI427_12320 [Flammeovirga pectinis]
MNSRQIYEKLLADKSTAKNYAKYNQLSEYQKKCLYNSNYWRVQTGEEPISVPESDTSYWEDIEKNLEKCHNES